MKKLSEVFKNLTAYDHFLVYLIILTILKITNVFVGEGQEAGFHFIKLSVALFAISSVIFIAFKYGLDRRKKYQHAVISTFIIPVQTRTIRLIVPGGFLCFGILPPILLMDPGKISDK